MSATQHVDLVKHFVHRTLPRWWPFAFNTAKGRWTQCHFPVMTTQGRGGAETLSRHMTSNAVDEIRHRRGEFCPVLQAPFLDDIRDVGDYDAAVLGVPFDGGATYRPGTRFGPQGIRRISALCKTMQP